MRVRGTMRRWICALVATAAAACGGHAVGANRDTASPDATAPGSIVVGGAVGESCSTDSQCPGPLRCRSRTCQDAPSNGTGASCPGGADCPSGICLYGQCKTSCQSAGDCVSGWTCPSDHLCDCSPSPEVCDGKDNDCDGIVDDEPAVDQVCELQTPGHVCVNGDCACKTTCGGANCVDLTSDAKNCGSCGTICAGTCTLGRCLIALAPAPSGAQSGFTPEYIAIDATSVYWTTCNDTQTKGSIMKVAIAGGSPIALARDEACPAGIAVNATSVYWITRSTAVFDSDGGIAPNGSLRKVALGGGPITTLVSGWSPVGVAVDSANVYWTDGEPALDPPSGVPAIVRVPTGGGVPTVLASGPSGGSESLPIALDRTNVYWASSYSNAVSKVALSSGASTTLAGIVDPSSGPAIALAVDPTGVYWTAGGNTNDGCGDVEGVPLVGGAANSLAGASRPLGIAADGTSVYWIETQSDCGSSLVRKVRRTGGGVTTLASGGAPGSFGIAVDATSVYWTSGSASAVIKLTPK